MRSLLQQPGWSGEYGGFKIEMARNAAKLGSLHILYDELSGFSALMKMFGYDPTATLRSRSFGDVKEWTTRAPMLALTNPDPALGLPAGITLQPGIFLHNISAKTYTAHIRFNWRSTTQTGKTAPIDIALGPDQTRLLDVASLQSQKLIPADAQWASVILSAPIQPDELMAVATSFDATGRYGAQTPFNDQLAAQWEAGMWEVDSTHDSLVAVTNGGGQPVKAELTILYNHGTENYRVERSLAPDEQMLLNFGNLIHNQIADSDGHTLPPDLMTGTYRIKDLSDRGRGSLYEGKITVDKTYGHAHYGCAECCGIDPEDVYMEFNPLAVGVSSYATQSVMAPNECEPDDIEDITSEMSTWGTDNSAIATVKPAAQVNGISAGSTTHFASGEAYAGEGHTVDEQCPRDLVQSNAGTDVGPYQVEPIDTASQGPAACSVKGQAGWVRNVTNQVQYATGAAYAVAGLSVSDDISVGTPNTLGVSSQQEGQTPTTGDGSFPDTYFVCSTACPGSGESDATQNWIVSGIPLFHVDGLVYKCGSISIDGN